MTLDRAFYSIAAALVATFTFIGVLPFYLRGQGMGDRTISPTLLPLVIVHGAALTTWVLLFLASPC